MRSVKITLGGLAALFGVATLFRLGKIQYAPQIGAGVAGLTFVVILVLWGSIALLKAGKAFKTAKVLELVFGSLLGFFGWIIGLLLTGQRSIGSQPLFVGLFCVFVEIAASVFFFRSAFQNSPMSPRAAKVTKIILGAVLGFMSLLSMIGVYEAILLVDRAAIFATFAASGLAGSLALFISAFKRRGFSAVEEKSCPKCNRKYDDMTQNFCLDDGAVLLTSSDPGATLGNPLPKTLSLSASDARDDPAFYGHAAVTPLRGGTSRTKVLIVAIAGAVVLAAAALLGMRRSDDKVAPQAPSGMVYVPGGEFRMGRNDVDQYEGPAHAVTVKPFFIDTHEVTRGDYRTCLDARKCVPPFEWPGPTTSDRLPMTGVSWEQAKAYATWAGKRLPTEEEWEFAARGRDGRRYPWGEDWGPALANANGASRALVDVGTHKGTSPFGALDMVGNAGEWTDSQMIAYPGGSLPLEIRVWVDRGRLSSYNVTLENVVSAIRAQKVDVSALEGIRGPHELKVFLRNRVDPRILEDVLVAKRNGYQVRIKDLGFYEIVTDLKVIRGGTYLSTPAEATTTYRRALRATGEYDYSNTGFRCARDLETQP